MIELVSRITRTLAAGHSLVAATIVTSVGSTPRTAGSKMLIFADGSIAGTVGGGLAEGQVIAAAPDVFRSGQARLIDFDMTGQAENGADLICGGRMRVFLERLDPEGSAVFEAAARLLADGGRGLVLTELDAPGAPRRCLLLPDGSVVGPAPAKDTLELARKKGRGIMAPVVLTNGERRYFLEPAASPDPLIICGGGHVSRPTAELATMVGFRVTILDDREEFANPGRFPFAAETAVIDPAVGWLTGRTIGPDACIVIVTRGHAHDQDALAEALGTPAAYIGMIGSLPKRDAIYDRLMARGFSAEALAKVKSPIGLEIAAETPEEIAVSIVAELIACRAARRP